MRMSWLSLLIALAPIPAFATPAPVVTLSAPTAKAGQPLTFTITRSGAMQGIYVLFSTADGTARAGIDYTATNQLIYLKSGQTSATVTVPTLANPAATGTLTLNAAIADSAVGVHATASIVEPALPPPPASWVTAPLTVGGYACNATQLNDAKTPACGLGIVYRITGSVPNGPSMSYTAVFYSDASGKFPASNAYDANFVSVWAPNQLQGLAPGP